MTVPARLARVAFAIVCVAMLVRPAAAAAATVSRSPGIGPPTSIVALGGTGFAADSFVDIYWDSTFIKFAVTDGSGAFAGVNVTVPASAAPGSHAITVFDHGMPSGGQTTFTVRTNAGFWRGQATGRALNTTENQLVPSALDWLEEGPALPVADGSYVTMAPVVSSGYVYAHTTSGRLIAYTVGTGTVKFNVAATAPSFNATSPAVGSSLVVVSGPDAVKAFNYSTGALVWQATLGGAPVSTPPVVVDGVVYVGGFATASDTTDFLYAFRTNCGSAGSTCTPLWKGSVGGYGPGSLPIPTTPIVGGGKVFVSRNGVMYAYAVGCGTGGATCVGLWSKLASYRGSPAYFNGLIYTPEASYLTVLRAGTSTTAWRGSMSGVGGSVAIGGGRVFVASNAGILYAFPAGGCGAASCSAIDSVAVMGSGDTFLAAGVLWVQTATDLSAFNQTCLACGALWRADLVSDVDTAASPAIVDGVVYAATGAARVQTYDLNRLRATIRWAGR